MCFKINLCQNCQILCAYRYQYLCTYIRTTICNFQICSFVLSYSMNLVQKDIVEISDRFSHIDYASKEAATIADSAEGASVTDDACASGKSSGENTIRFVSQISNNRAYVHISGSAIFNLFLSHRTHELTIKILRRIRKYVIFAFSFASGGYYCYCCYYCYDLREKRSVYRLNSRVTHVLTILAELQCERKSRDLDGKQISHQFLSKQSSILSRIPAMP